MDPLSAFKFHVDSRDPEQLGAYNSASHQYRPAYIHPTSWVIRLQFDIEVTLKQLKAKLLRLRNPHPPRPDEPQRPGTAPLHGGVDLDREAEIEQKADQLERKIAALKTLLSTHDFQFRVNRVTRRAGGRFGILAEILGPAQLTPINQHHTAVTVGNVGLYKLTALVKKKNSNEPAIELAQYCTLIDVVICAVGDSYMSGEGNPDVPLVPTPAIKSYANMGGQGTLSAIGRYLDDKYTPETELAQWQEPLAHRSYKSSPFYAARAVEGRHADAYITCTTVSYARTGAAIELGLLAPFIAPTLVSPTRKNLRIAFNPNPSDGTGQFKLIPVETMQSSTLDYELKIGQIDEMQRSLGPRKVDFLVMTIGGNDCNWIQGFAAIIKPFFSSGDKTASEVFTEVSHIILNELAAKFLKLNDKIASLPHPPRFVLLALYPASFFGDGSPDNPTINRNCGIFDTFDFNPFSGSDSFIGLDDDEVRILNGLAEILNDKLKQIAGDLSRNNAVLNAQNPNTGHQFSWVIVDKIDRDFACNGYCADLPFYRGASESFLRQGDWRGLLHPNERGQRAYGNRIAEKISELINANLEVLRPPDDGLELNGDFGIGHTVFTP